MDAWIIDRQHALYVVLDQGLNYIDVITAKDGDLENQRTSNPGIADPEIELCSRGRASPRVLRR